MDQLPPVIPTPWVCSHQDIPALSNKENDEGVPTIYGGNGDPLGWLNHYPWLHNLLWDYLKGTDGLSPPARMNRSAAKAAKLDVQVSRQNEEPMV